MASEDLLKKAVAAFDALSPEQQAEMMEEQRQSWVRGNVGLSRDERGMTSPMMSALKTVREENSIGRQAVKAWADSNTRPTPVAPVSPDATGKPWPYQQTFNAIAAATRIEGGNIAVSVDKFAEAFGPTHATPVAPVSPDATGKCGELVTVGYQYWRDQTQEWLPTGFPNSLRMDGFPVRELVTRTQAVELLAAEIRRERDLAAKQLSEVVDRMSDDYLALKADNAALTARVKELEGEVFHDPELGITWKQICEQFDQECSHHQQRADKAEIKLTAAERALELVDKAVSEGRFIRIRKIVRAALGGKPS